MDSVRIAIPAVHADNVSMRNKRHQLMCYVALAALLYDGGSAVFAQDQSGSDLLQKLGADDFAVRSAASAALQKLSAEKVSELAADNHNQPNAEVMMRLQAEMERRYASAVEEDVIAASAILEAHAADDRLMLADAAQHTLRQHWTKRTELALNELEKHGAIVRRGTFIQNRGFPGFAAPERSQTKTVLLTEDWTGGDQEIEIFRRLSALCGPVRSGSGMSLFLIGGNKLTDDQVARVSEIVGHNRVVKRSRVALGIEADRHVTRGVLIDQVSPGSSAADAGLKRGDLIIAINERVDPKTDDAAPVEPPEAKPEDSDSPDTPQNKVLKPATDEADPDDDMLILPDDKTLLRDFDDLVDRLMDYDVDDVMTIRVYRGFAPNGIRMRFGGMQPTPEPMPLKIETLHIKMKGWEHLAVETE